MTSQRAAAQALVKDGFRAQGAGNVEQAQRCYLEALEFDAEQADALQLLGALARRRGDTTAAEVLLRRSLSARPAQPHVLNNLGNLLVAQQRADEAERCFAQALAFDPRHVDALYNRARLLHSVGRLTDAAASLTQAMEFAARPTPQMLQLQAQIESDSGNVDAALATLDSALLVAPDSAALLHNRAILLQQTHHYVEALRDHLLAGRLGMDVADAHYNRGNTQQSLGHQADAAASYRAALLRDPGHRLALFDLSRLRWRMGDADFDAELRHAAAMRPDASAPVAMRAHLLLRAEQFAEAADAFRQALARDEQSPGLYDGLGCALVRLGDFDAALQAHAKAVALAPDDAALHANHASSLLAARQFQAGLVQAQRACELAPDDQHALALMGHAWRLLGDAREPWLNDQQRFVRVIELQAPDGYPNMQQFNADLRRALDSLHVDRRAPLDQTLRNGTQTMGNLFDQRHATVQALQTRLFEALTAYVQALPFDPAHPVTRRRTSAWRYSDSWSSCLGNGGFHTNHVHPHGWISATYYVAVPHRCTDASAKEGWLRIGQPGAELNCPLGPTLEIEPRAGRLVLFPSMFWHGTTPFGGTEQRLSIAFDVLPVRPDIAESEQVLFGI